MLKANMINRCFFVSRKYYKTKWDGLTKQQMYDLSKVEEDKLMRFLIKSCGFNQIIPTRDSITTIAKGKNLILPDLMGLHDNGCEYFIELKSKNRRMLFNDNGINDRNARDYLIVEQEFDKKVLIVFLDDESEWKSEYPNIVSWFKNSDDKCAYYGNWIKKLFDETPRNPITKTFCGSNAIICFPLNNMTKIENIFKERQTRLNFEVII